MARSPPRPSVLLVDDHPANLITLEAILEPLKLRLVRASSGECALEHLLREDFAVILLDACMPGMDGFETARLIRQRPRHRGTPIILVSAIYRDEAHIIQGYAEGVMEYLVKPVNPETLRTKVALFAGLFSHDRGLKEQAALVSEEREELLAREQAALREAALQRERLQGIHDILRKSEERFRSLTHALSQIVWTTDARGRVTEDSPSWRAFTGQPLERYLAANPGWLECIHPEDRGRTVQAWKTAVRERSLFEVEHRLRRRDGRYREMLVRGVPVRGEDGHVREWVGVHIDVTERRRAQRASTFLAQASALLTSSLDGEAALRNVARLVVPALADWCAVDLLAADGSVQRVAGFHRDPQKAPLVLELRRRGALDWNARHGLTRVLRTGEPEWVEHVPESLLIEEARDEGHLALLLRLGLRSWLCVPLLSRGRTLGALTLVSADSGRSYDEEDLHLAEDLARRAAISVDNARLFREAKEAVQVRDEFLSVASHELKTPLTPLRLKLQAMRRTATSAGETPEAQRMLAHLDVAERQVSKLNRLIESLLDVSRISAHKLELDLEDVDLAEVVREVAGRFEPEAHKVGCDVRVHAPRPTIGRWDRMRLEQVVTNLLSNALKYGAGKPVTLEVGTHGDQAVLVVRDQGIGIEQGNLSRIFDRFERAVSERHYGGLGLGLYITRQIVEALGGGIAAQSTPEQGSTFIVTLPGLQAAWHPPQQQPPASGAL
jgi:PAS domain S-box-containing protein